MTKKRHKGTKQYAKYLTGIFKLKRNCLLMKIFLTSQLNWTYF